MTSSAAAVRVLLLSGTECIHVSNNQRPGSLVGEHFTEDPFRRLVGHHVNAPDPTVDRPLDLLCLGQHALDDPSFLAQSLEATKVGVGNQGCRVFYALQD